MAKDRKEKRAERQEARAGKREKRAEDRNSFDLGTTWLNEQLAKLSVDDPDFAKKSEAIMVQAYSKFPGLNKNKKFAEIQKTFDRLLPTAQSGAQLLADIYDFVSSNKDIRLSDEERKKLSPPGLPKPSDGRVIKERLEQARVQETTAGVTEQARVQRITDDQYAQDLGQARVASTGQAAAYGSYAQAAANRRARGKLAGQTGVRAAVDAAQLRTDRLAGMAQSADERRVMQEQINAQMLEARYARDQEYVNELGQSGRQGRRNALQNMVGPLSNLGTQLGAQLGNRDRRPVDADPTLAPLGGDPSAAHTGTPFDISPNYAYGMGAERAPIEYNPNDYSAQTDATAATATFNQNNQIGDYYTPPVRDGRGRWSGMPDYPQYQPNPMYSSELPPDFYGNQVPQWSGWSPAGNTGWSTRNIKR